MTDIRIVHNRLLGGWFVVRGPHHTPLNGRFETRKAAFEWLRSRIETAVNSPGFADRVRAFKERNSDGHY